MLSLFDQGCKSRPHPPRDDGVMAGLLKLALSANARPRDDGAMALLILAPVTEGHFIFLPPWGRVGLPCCVVCPRSASRMCAPASKGPIHGSIRRLKLSCHPRWESSFQSCTLWVPGGLAQSHGQCSTTGAQLSHHHHLDYHHGATTEPPPLCHHHHGHRRGTTSTRKHHPHVH